MLKNVVPMQWLSEFSLDWKQIASLTFFTCSISTIKAKFYIILFSLKVIVINLINVVQGLLHYFGTRGETNPLHKITSYRHQ